MLIDKAFVSVREFFATRLYRIDSDQVRYDLPFALEVIGVLVEKFLTTFSPDRSPVEMDRRTSFCLGSVTTTDDRERGASVLEGAGLLVTLLLVLIYLRHAQAGHPHGGDLERTVYYRRFGKVSMNPVLEECQPALEALFHNRDFDFEDAPQEALDIAVLFSEIEENFPAGIEPESFPYFTDWLLHCVTLDHTHAVTADGARILEMARLGEAVAACLNL